MFLSKGRRVWISSDLLCSFVLIMLYHYYWHSSIESANNVCEHFVFSALSHFAIHLYAKQELFTSGSRDWHQYKSADEPELTNIRMSKRPCILVHHGSFCSISKGMVYIFRSFIVPRFPSPSFLSTPDPDRHSYIPLQSPLSFSTALVQPLIANADVSTFQVT